MRRFSITAPRFITISLLLAMLVLPAALPQAAAAEPGEAQFLVIHVDRVTPESVTTTGPPTVTVSGTVENVGDRPVRDVVARLERAPAVENSSQLRTDLGGENSQFSPVGEFIDISEELQHGQQAPFVLSYPLRSTTEPALDIQTPGVYPLLVNVNGTPDYGDPARLDDARFLLPVLGVPRADAPPGEDPGVDVADVVAPDTSRPVPVTMLWPLADRPQLAPGVPGGTTPVRLADDSLATSLAPGGRLDMLLAAAEFATGPTVDPGGEITRALCLAVDPDLLVTVNAMTGGYVVGNSANPLAPPSNPGGGQAAATAWLDRLRELAGRMCVTATPYAQADLDAVDRVGDPNLGTFATTTVFDLVDQILGVTSTRGVTVVGDGPLTSRVVHLLTDHGPTVAIAAADGFATDENTGDPVTADLSPRRLSGQVVTVPFDPTVGAALAALGSPPTSPSYLDSSLTVPLDHDSEVSRRQDALSAMVWRGLHPSTEPRAQVLVPPLTWNPDADDAQAVLTTLATSIRSGLAVPEPLADVIAGAEAVHGPLQPVSAAADNNQQGRIDDAVVAQLSGELGRLWGLTAALTTNTQTGLTGVAYTAPLREDMLRALSQSEPAQSRNELARQRLGVVGGTIEDLFGAVTIVNPGGAYTLATERSPLPLALRNDLAVPIRVRLNLDVPPGMTVEDIGEQELPPGYLPIRVPIEVHFTQRVAVDVSLRTPDGLALGEPVRLSVNSNAYGQVLFFITLAAGAVLALLTGRRLWHRFRGQPDRADLDRPEPGQT
ncbi:hypothetical protein BVC93_12150 [Mycobacterium sp. MS1601]|nr:hypothetical protein BVC93_12150 [Mycobacterium sp. MS1601]